MLFNLTAVLSCPAMATPKMTLTEINKKATAFNRLQKQNAVERK